jgi:hypothetical protein
MRGRLGVLEVFACLLLVIGVLGDHLSTMMVLSKPSTYEANPIVASLMEEGLWLPLDAVMMAAGLVIPQLLMRIERRFRILFLYPLIHGLLRLSMALWNLHLFLSLGF